MFFFRVIRAGILQVANVFFRLPSSEQIEISTRTVHEQTSNALLIKGRIKKHIFQVFF